MDSPVSNGYPRTESAERIEAMRDNPNNAKAREAKGSRQGYILVISQEKGIPDHYICAICRGGFARNKMGRIEAIACCAAQKGGK
jgi:hypothetical protein